MPDVHARLSPSAAARWINCPGSVRLAEQFPSASTSYTEEGTTAHAIAEAKLKGKNLTALKKNEYFCGEMDEATDFYVDAVHEVMAEEGKDAELMVEQRLPIDDYAPGCFGTGDAIVIGADTIHVIDLKYGKGVKVSAEGNPQLRLYGLGAAALFRGLYDFVNVSMTIIQPRLDHISTETMRLEDLKAWAEKTVVPAAKEAYEGSDKTACGDWCRFCPAKAICRTRAEANLELAKMEFREPELLTQEEIGRVLAQADELRKWAADVEGYALDQAMQGKAFEGWKVVEGRANRRYADELKVAEALMSAGYNEAMLYERKLYGLTAMEKLVGKKKLTEILGDLIVKPQGKPVLVPLSDKREAINTAKTDFMED